MGIDVRHTPGEFLVADAMTKILKGERLRELSNTIGTEFLSKPNTTEYKTATHEHLYGTGRGCQGN